MFKSFVISALLGVATASFADGPGSRIRTGPAAPPPLDRDIQRCEALRAEAKERCLRELRAALRGAERAPHEGPNPESTGMGAGAGSSGPEATGMGSGAGSGSSSGKR